ncbi:hypothetical protein G647_02749 [Cladophialophora carrionii CBS 160.54]|uniref:Tat pathway signal sequence n=1 Tax=Cladophialophora carrionii CBS 160.54 TaxID=1279043 RepID=V9DJ57_9EURO|nr:uncharacterized protein G647_02749 [Cladophialophora carrionii CBS 160.54]ETI25972.1 hypothetical protein G647_02749 [Cladophialophora carrionii CBS 160.54]
MAPFSFSRAMRMSYSPAPSEEVSSEKLLGPESNEDGEALSNRDTIIAIERVKRRWKLLALSSSGLVAVLLLALTWMFASFKSREVPSLYSPAEVAVEYETVVFHNNFWEDRTPYQGPPTDEVDMAWDALYKDVGVIKVDGRTARQVPNMTLPIPGEEDSYILGIEVFHQLHCLNSIRKGLYPDRYQETKDMSDNEKRLYWIHIEHCVDSIRQTIQCYSDINTIPWVISPRHHRPAPDAHTTHMCRRFDKIQEWAKERAFTQKEYDLRLAAQQQG